MKLRDEIESILDYWHDCEIKEDGNPLYTRDQATDDILMEVYFAIKNVKPKAKSYKFTSNLIKNGQNCKAYKAKIQNEIIAEYDRAIIEALAREPK